MQNEAQLALAEMSQKITGAGIGAAYVAGAAVLFIPALVVLLLTLAIWLTELGLSPVLAHLVAALVGALLGVILAAIGMSYFKIENLKPKVTLQQVRRDVTTAKELVR